MNPTLPPEPNAFQPSRDYPYRKSLHVQSLSLEEVSAEFDRYTKEWEDSTRPDILSRMFVQEQQLFPSIEITQCVCIALGAFARSLLPDQDCIYGTPVEIDSSMRQLVALTKMLELLKTAHAITDIYIQDPLFNDVETAFLTQLGYKVLQDPQAEGKITNSTFLFAPHCEHKVATQHLLKGFPALYLGNDPEKMLRKDRRCQEAGVSSIFFNCLDIPVADTYARFAEATFVTMLHRKQNPMWLGHLAVRWLKVGSRISGPNGQDEML